MERVRTLKYGSFGQKRLSYSAQDASLRKRRDGKPPRKAGKRKVAPGVSPGGRLANPAGQGYGNAKQWPFDVGRAIHNPRYASAIRLAVTDDRYSHNWRSKAQQVLLSVKLRRQQDIIPDEDVLMVAAAMEEMQEMSLMELNQAREDPSMPEWQQRLAAHELNK